MRYLPIDQVRENSILATPIFNEYGGILLNANVKLKRSYLKRLKLLGYVGLYIYDEISKDVIVEELLPEEVRIQTIQSLQKLNVDECRLLAHSIVDELLNRSNIRFEMMSVASFDSYTYIHSINVAVLSVIVGIASGFRDSQLKLLSEAALLHDIGKLSVKLEILNKKEQLTEEEIEIMRSHPQEGYEMLKDNLSISHVVKQAILSHHENLDGTGYPRGLKGEEIGSYARIIHICDVYDALTSDRVYRMAMNPAEAIEYLMANCWTMFDAQFVMRLLEYVSPYPNGLTVELSSGESALIVRQSEVNRSRPVVRILKTKEDIDLMKRLDITITKVLIR